jgi:hypothetical protein
MDDQNINRKRRHTNLISYFLRQPPSIASNYIIFPSPLTITIISHYHLLTIYITYYNLFFFHHLSSLAIISYYHLLLSSLIITSYYHLRPIISSLYNHLLQYNFTSISYYYLSRLGMALKASNVVGNPVTLHRIW